MFNKETRNNFVNLLANSSEAKEIYNLWNCAKSNKERDFMSLCELQYKLKINSIRFPTLSEYILKGKFKED